MKRITKKMASLILVFAMVCTAFVGYLPSLDVLAAPKKMAHLKSGSGNGNAHFGGGTPEAFVLSDKADVRNEDLSVQFKVASEAKQTRLRFVTKYVDDTHWGFIAYDGASGWLYQYKNGNQEQWPSLTGLPEVNKDDVVNISTSYETDGLHVKVENETTKKSGTAVAKDSNFVNLKDSAGKIGVGAATFGTEYTDIYFSDVTAGTTRFSDYSAWTLYRKDAAGQVWEPSVEISDGDEPAGEGRAWIELKGGKNNSGGHAYGDSKKAAPVLLLDNDKRMEASGELSLALKPSDN